MCGKTENSIIRFLGEELAVRRIIKLHFAHGGGFGPAVHPVLQDSPGGNLPGAAEGIPREIEGDGRRNGGWKMLEGNIRQIGRASCRERV